MPRKPAVIAASTLNITEEEVKAKRIENLAAKKRKALEDLAETEALSRDLGVSEQTQDEVEAEVQGNGFADGERLEQILSEIRNDGFWEASRMVNGKQCKMGRFDMSAWPDHLEQLARDVGGGTITIQFRAAQGGAYVGQITRHFDPATYKLGSAANPMPPSKDEAVSESMGKFMEMMERREMQYKQEMAEMRRENLELQKMMFQSLSSQDPFRSVNGIKSLMEMFKTEKPRSPLDSVKEVFETIRILRGESLEPPSIMETLISKACDMLAPVLKANAGVLPGASPANAVAPPAAKAQIAGIVPPVKSNVPAPAPADNMALVYKNLGEQLMLFINKGSSADTAASAVADLLTAENVMEFKPWADDPLIADKIMTACPALFDRKVWLVDFANLMKEYIDDFLNPEPEPENADARHE